MFSLIITIVSIALVAALAVATIYYGGDAMSQGQASAKASTIVNAGEQVAAAISLYRLNTGEWPASLDTLVAEKYLNGLPEIAAADGFSFISSAHAAPVTTGDWLYDAEMPHLAYTRQMDLSVCAEVNKHTNNRRMVLNVIDPGMKIQCVAAGSAAPAVIFRNSGVALTGMPGLPGSPDVGDAGDFEEVGRGIDEDGEDTSGRCVYSCEPGGGGGGGGAPFEPQPPVQPPVQPGPTEGGDWVAEGPGYCSPSTGDDEEVSVEFTAVAESASQVTVTGEYYVSSEEDYDFLQMWLNGSLRLAASGDRGWVPFSFRSNVGAGPVSLRAAYSKDEAYGEGEDRACVRGVTFSFAESGPTAEGVEEGHTWAPCSIEGQGGLCAPTEEVAVGEEEVVEITCNVPEGATQVTVSMDHYADMNSDDDTGDSNEFFLRAVGTDPMKMSLADYPHGWVTSNYTVNTAGRGSGGVFSTVTFQVVYARILVPRPEAPEKVAIRNVGCEATTAPLLVSLNPSVLDALSDWSVCMDPEFYEERIGSLDDYCDQSWWSASRHFMVGTSVWDEDGGLVSGEYGCLPFRKRGGWLIDGLEDRPEQWSGMTISAQITGIRFGDKCAADPGCWKEPVYVGVFDGASWSSLGESGSSTYAAELTEADEVADPDPLAYQTLLPGDVGICGIGYGIAGIPYLKTYDITLTASRDGRTSTVDLYLEPGW